MRVCSKEGWLPAVRLSRSDAVHCASGVGAVAATPRRNMSPRRLVAWPLTRTACCACPLRLGAPQKHVATRASQPRQPRHPHTELMRAQKVRMGFDAQLVVILREPKRPKDPVECLD